MPSVVDKASQFSSNRRQNVLSPILGEFPGKKRLAKLYHRFNLVPLPLSRRLVYQRSDMPRGSEEKVFITRNKRSSASPEPTSRQHLRQRSSSGGSHTSRVKDQENGQGRWGSPASQSGQANTSAVRHRSEAVNKCAKLLNVPLPSGGERQAADLNHPDVEPTNPSAAYLEYCINKELIRRRQVIVEKLMAAITECFERRLEALEEGCDAEGSQHSGAFQAGDQTSSSTGQKRSSDHHSRDEDAHGEDDGDSFNRKRDSKRTKTTKDDTRPRFACPYFQRDPKTFGTRRTCCGPGWFDISRVKEHLERKHSLPPYQCHRCLYRFKKEEDLKKHQRENTPCPVKEPYSIQRNLLDGYDEEQAKKLKPRSKKNPVEKWKVWYCILFEVSPDSPDIPSPYHDPSISGTGNSSIKIEKVQEWRDYWTKAKPVIHRHVTMAVAKALDDFEPQVKSNILDRLQDLPRMIAERIPFSGLSSEETSTAADELGFLSCLDSFGPDDYGEDSFDFEGLDNPAIFNSSDTWAMAEPSDSSDADPAVDSSATSVEDDTTYQHFDYKSVLLPASIDFGPLDNSQPHLPTLWALDKMIHPTVLYMVVSFVLLILAIVVHVYSSNLSLGISPTLSVLTILLPIAGFFNTAFHPRLSRSSSSSNNNVTKLAPFVVQVLQALVTTILATLLLERIVPSAVTNCMLDTQWTHMFRTHDANGIRRIQDSFDCCGLNSIRDRAYPFPGMAPSTCAETYGRRTACREPWRGAHQTASSLDLVVVLGVGLIQIFGLLLTKDGAGWWNAWGNRHDLQTNQHRESRRPLLTGVVEEEEEAAPERPERESRGYRSVNGNEFGPRVEPSSVVERNNWTED
ncbi:hypothetical protein F66182_6562 [Fusarium sp. NRRL 66182]|nr:hypothetical protein F66182_6562 [Fusarium sp. NRRL 66182]